jgi:glycosyltransferase involved in cell wall biosynthesis
VAQWYGAAEVHRFRRVLNYKLLGRLRRLGRVPALVGMLADAVMEQANSVRVKRLTRRHNLGLVHCNNGPLPREALFGAFAAGLPCVAHMRGFVAPGRRESSLRRRAVSRYIAVSRAVAASVVATGTAPERVVTIYNPVDVARFATTAVARAGVRYDLNLPEGDFAVGIFGRVVAWKGQLEFVQAVLRALPECPELKGVVVGDESDADRAYMRRVRECAEASGHGDRFVFVGYQPAVEKFYHAVDAVVHASIEPEPFGRVIPEGMAARKPVIAAAGGGAVELIAEGEDGLLVPPGDVEGRRWR